ncbi:ankyrin repeat-containing protein npr4, partial [Fagus crenata]
TNKISELKHYKDLILCMCKGLQGLNRKQVDDGRLEEATVKAVKKGTVEFVKAILSACPNLVRCQETPLSRNLFMLAVLHRQSERWPNLPLDVIPFQAQHFICKAKYDGSR